MLPSKDLPYDVYLDIARYFSKHDISALTKTVKALRDRFQPLLYEEFAIHINFEKPGFTKFLRTITESPDLAQYVKRVDTSWWSASSIFANRDGPSHHRKPLATDARVLYSAIDSLHISQSIKDQWVKGLRRELFIRDDQLKRHRQFSKPDTFLALLLAKLTNLEDLRLDLYECCGERFRLGPRASFPSWTWRIIELNNIDTDRRQTNRCLQRLSNVTILHASGLLDGSRGLPWLQLPSIKTLELSNISIDQNLNIHARSSPVEKLLLSNVVANYEQLATLLKIPKCLEAFTYIQGYDSGIEWFSPDPPNRNATDVTRILCQYHAATLKTLVIDVVGIHDRQRDMSTDGRKVTEPLKLHHFKDLRNLEIGLWQLVGFDWNDVLQYPHGEFMTGPLPQFVDFLPSALRSLTIHYGDRRLAANLHQLAGARGYPTYKFRELKSVKIIMRDLEVFKEDFVEVFGDCKVEIASAGYLLTPWPIIF